MRHWVELLGRRVEFSDGDYSVSAPHVAREMQLDLYRLGQVDLPDGATVVDVGANVGLFSIWACLRWPTCRVVAVEPMPLSFGMLWHNVWLNGLQDRVTLVNAAVAARPGPVTIAAHKAASGGSSAYAPWAASHRDHWRHQARAVTLDELFAAHVPGRCDVLKLDCEGAEHEAIYAASSLGMVDRMRGEFHDNGHLGSMGHTAEKLAAYCRRFVGDLEYQHFRMSE